MEACKRYCSLFNSFNEIQSNLIVVIKRLQQKPCFKWWIKGGVGGCEVGFRGGRGGGGQGGGGLLREKGGGVGGGKEEGGGSLG